MPGTKSFPCGSRTTSLSSPAVRCLPSEEGRGPSSRCSSLALNLHGLQCSESNESAMSAEQFLLYSFSFIHRSAWNRNSPKFAGLGHAASLLGYPAENRPEALEGGNK